MVKSEVKNLRSLGTGFFCVSLNIFELYSGTQITWKHLIFLGLDLKLC